MALLLSTCSPVSLSSWPFSGMMLEFFSPQDNDFTHV